MARRPKTVGVALGAFTAAALALTAAATGDKTLTLTDADLKKDNV